MNRKNWLVNSLGRTYELTNKESKVFLSDIKGLGTSNKITISRSGNEASVETEEKELPNPSGTLLFFGDKNENTYTLFKGFIEFIKYQPLKLYQQLPSGFDSFYIDCLIEDLPKDEINKDGVLYSEIKFKGTSFWKQDKENDKEIREVVSGGKTYPYTFPYSYEGNSFAHIDVVNSGDIACGFQLEIHGRITNPILSIFQNDVKYGEIAINGTYDKIIVDTRDKKENVYLELNHSPIANPTGKLVINGNGAYETPFPKFKVGSNVLTFACGGSFNDAIHIKWQDIWSIV